MKSSNFYTLAFIACLLQSIICHHHKVDVCMPQQIHFALGDTYYNVMYNYELSNGNSNSSAVIVWNTYEYCPNNYAQIIQVETGLVIDIMENPKLIYNFSTYINAEEEEEELETGNYTEISHTIPLYNLTHDTLYNYFIYYQSSSGSYSSVGPFKFILPNPSTENQKIQFLVFGDIDNGKSGNSTIAAMDTLFANNFTDITGLISLGDIAYNLFSDVGERGDIYFNSIQNISASWPYMMTPGNHEVYQNFTFLDYRLRMPMYNQTSNQYFSFNLGPIHFLALCMDYYDEMNKTNATDLAQAMYDWIVADLTMANNTRDQRPWIVILTHRPVYCSHNSLKDKAKKRCYSFYEKRIMWEQLFVRYNVDLVLQAHVHAYERLGPIANNQSMPYVNCAPPGVGDLDNVVHYICNATAPVYIVEGAAGNDESMVKSDYTLENFSIFDDVNVGHGLFTYINKSTLLWQHLNSSNGALLDYMYLIKPQYELLSQVTVLVERESNTNWMISAFFAGLVLIAVSIFIYYPYYLKRKRFSQLERQETEFSLQI